MLATTALLTWLGVATAGQDVVLAATDGTSLHASVDRAADGKRGVVLVHMNARSSEDWRFVSEKLARSGMTAVAVDLRGHGTSAPIEGALTDDHYAAMESDVAAAVAWLRSQGITDVACAGASLGANLCLRVAAADKGIVNLALLSPALKKHGLTTAAAMVEYGDRPVLFVASTGERYDALSAEKLEARATGQKHFELLTDAGHGTKMLNRDPGLEGLLLSWLLGTFELSPGDVVRPRPASNNTVDDIETEGKKIGQ